MARFEIGQSIPADRAITWELLTREVDRLVLTEIGKTSLHQSFDMSMHHLDALTRSRIVIRGDDSKECEVLMELRFEFTSDLEGITLRRLRLGEELVLVEVLAHVPDIGDVLHQLHSMSFEFQGSTDDVREKEGTEIPKMGIAIDGGTAAVDAYLFTVACHDLTKFAREGVVDSHACCGPTHREDPLSTMRNAKTFVGSNEATEPSLRLTLPGATNSPSRSRKPPPSS